MADPYRSQVAPGFTPLSGASAESFGAAVGRGMEEAGANIDSAIHRIKERDRDQEAADAGLALASVSTKIDKAAIDARAVAAPGGAGHSAAIEKQFDDEAKAELARIKDPHVRQAFTVRYAELRDHIVTREYGWEAAAGVDKLVTDVDRMGTTLANGAAVNQDPGGFQVAQSTIATAIGAMHIPDDLKAKLIKEQQRKVAVAWANGTIDNKPALLVGDGKVKGLLDTGELNAYLEPEDIDRLRSGAHVEIRRQEAEERQKHNLEAAEARETIGVFVKELSAGVVHEDADFDKMRALAKTYDLKGYGFDLDNWQDKIHVNREYRTASPAQIHADINALEAKGDKRTPGEDIRLTHLKEIAPNLVGRFNSDPHAAAAAAGTPAPPLNPADPKSIEARVTWARSYASSAGLVDVPYLSNDEMKPLKDRVAQGVAGQLDVAAELKQAFGVSTATAIARQVDPANKDLQLMVGYEPAVAQLYKVGDAALKGNTVKLGVDEFDQQAMRDIFAEYSKAIPGELQPAVLNAARGIAAGLATKGHLSQLSGEDLDGIFRMAVQRAGGMTGAYFDGHNTPGGFARWQGQYAWLPTSMSRDDFARRISRADGAAWIRAAGSAPHYLGADGKLVKLNDRQIAHLKEYSLETVNPGVYRMIAPDGGRLYGPDGKPWTFDIRKLGPSFDQKLADHGYVRR